MSGKTNKITLLCRLRSIEASLGCCALGVKDTEPCDLFLIGTISEVVVDKAGKCRFERVKTAWAKGCELLKTDHTLGWV